MANESSHSVTSTFVLRTPLLPINVFECLGDSDLTNEKTLLGFWQLDYVSTAIRLTSPDLYAQLEKLFRAGHITEKKKKRLIVSFTKYLIRMSTRCTPFGILAGCGIGKFNSKTKVILSAQKSYRVAVRKNWLDEYDKKLASSLSELQEKPKWFPNTSLYRVGKNWRFLEVHRASNGYEYTSEQIEGNEFLDEIISMANKGAKLSDLSKCLQEMGVSLSDAKSYLKDLIFNQIIEPINIRPPINSNAFGFKNHYLGKLEPGLTNNVSCNLFTQTESCQLSYENRKYIHNSISFLSRLNPKQENARLKRFKEVFLKKYGNREVSLGNVLDPEYGIDYLESNPFIGDSSFLSHLNIKKANNQNSIDLTIDKNLIVLNSKLQEAILTGKKIIEIEDGDFNFQKEHVSPKMCCALVELTKINDEEILFVKNIYKGNSAKMIARFGLGNDEIQAMVDEIVTIEESAKNEDCILAEIIHLPSPTATNIVGRCVKRKFEIPYFGRSHKESNKKIEVEDILVSVQWDEIFLKSKKLNKRVIPIHTNVHNYENSPLAIYQFLCDLDSHHNEQVLNFDWGALKSIYRYFPRVIYKSTILSKATWVFQKKDIPAFSDSIDKETILSWQKKYKLPSLFYLVEEDNKLLIDLKSELLIEVFYNEIKNEKWIKLEEYIFYEGTPVFDVNGNNYTNEFLIYVEH